MRFILNFIFFGILFYLIYLFFPEAFKTLVSWADHTVAYFTDLFHNLWGKYGQNPSMPPAPTPKEPHMTWLMLPFLRSYFKF